MRRFVFAFAALLVVITILMGSSTHVANAASVVTVKVSSENASACSDDSKASCGGFSFVGIVPGTAQYEFDCNGDNINLPLLQWLLSILGIPLTQFEKLIIPGVPTPMCTLFAQGSKFEVTENSPNGTSINILENTYNGWKNEGTFEVKANYTYKLTLNAHGRDFREVLKSNSIGAFDSYFKVSYPTGDLDDDVWENADYFDLPYSGNLEYSGDQDWQRVNVPAGDTFLVLDVPEGKNYQLELWRDDTKTQLGSSSNGTGVDESILISQHGYYRVHVFGANPTSDFGVPYRVFLDGVAPSTKVTPSGTAGDNGWYRSNVQVTLQATDNPGGSGVRRIEYGFNGTPWNPYTGPWNVYSGPFTISTEGHTYVVYRATDIAGNVEPNQTQLIKIDKTPPTISGAATTTPNTNGWYNTNVVVSFSASDFQSGVASLTPMNYIFANEGAHQSVAGTAIDNAGNSATSTVGNINIDKTPPTIAITSPQAKDYPHTASFNTTWTTSDGLSGMATSSGMLDNKSVANGQPIDLFFMSLGSHTVTIQAKDKADNAASLTVTFKVTSDINSLMAATKRTYDLGWIDKPGAYNSLDSKLTTVKSAIEKNQLNTARNELNALINEMDAQKGKAVNQQAYEMLKADVSYVIEHLQ